jgi:hypothetical protein
LVSGFCESGDLPRNHRKQRFQNHIRKKKKMAVAALVLGIVGLVISFIPCLGLYGLFLTVPGLIFGLVGISKAKKAKAGMGLAIAGLICSLIGTAIAGWQFYVIKHAATGLSEAIDKAAKDANKAAKDADNAKEIEKQKEPGNKLNEEGNKKATEVVQKANEAAQKANDAAQKANDAAQKASEAVQKAADEAKGALKSLGL